MNANVCVDDFLKKLSRDVKAFCLPGDCQRLESPPTALVFYRDYVSANLPVVIKGAFTHWPAASKWEPKYLSEKLGEKELSVEVTPSAYYCPCN